MKLFLIVLSFFLFNKVYAQQMTQPEVSRRALICDQWQWIGNGNTTWGCLTTPRETKIASGAVTDEVIKSLQVQIHQLHERLKKLEESK